MMIPAVPVAIKNVTAMVVVLLLPVKLVQRIKNVFPAIASMVSAVNQLPAEFVRPVI